MADCCYAFVAFVIFGPLGAFMVTHGVGGIKELIVSVAVWWIIVICLMLATAAGG